MIAGKVWGQTRLIVRTPLFEAHEINVNAGMRCSRHYHKSKINGFFLLDGVLNIHVVKAYGLTDVTRMLDGDYVEVPPGEEHWFQTDVDHGAHAMEFYYLAGMSPEDIVRANSGGPIWRPPIKEQP